MFTPPKHLSIPPPQFQIPRNNTAPLTSRPPFSGSNGIPVQNSVYANRSQSLITVYSCKSLDLKECLVFTDPSPRLDIDPTNKVSSDIM